MAVLDAEQEEAVLLSSCLYVEDFPRLTIARLREEDFQTEAARAGYRALLDLVGNGQPVTPFTFRDALARVEGREHYGAILVAETEALLGTGDWMTLVDRVRERARRKRVERRAARLMHLAADPATPEEELQRTLQALSADVSGRAAHKQPVQVDCLLEEVAATWRDRGRETGSILTRFPKVDQLLGGLRRQRLYVLGARPSMGKTAFALQLATNIALSGPVLFAALEMSGEDMVVRYAAQALRIPTAALGDTDLLAARGGLPLDLYPHPARLGEFVSVAQSWAATRHEPAAIFVDYLGLLQGRNNYEEASLVSVTLQRLARELDVAMVAVHQLSRAVEQRTDKRPILSDLRDSGQLEQDAHAVLFLYRPHVYDKRQERHLAELHVPKNRTGPTGTVHLHWSGPIVRFQEATTDDDDHETYGLPPAPEMEVPL